MVGTRDGEDPQFAGRLQQLTAVDLAGHFSSQRTAQGPRYAGAGRNALVGALESRASVASAAAQNLGDANALRQYVHPQTITAILEAREVEGQGPEQIERDFGLAPGVLEKLGKHLRRPTAKRAEPKTVVNPGTEARKVQRALDMNSDMDGEVKH